MDDMGKRNVDALPRTLIFAEGWLESELNSILFNHMKANGYSGYPYEYWNKQDEEYPEDLYENSHLRCARPGHEGEIV
jgi:hypothetical protein